MAVEISVDVNYRAGVVLLDDVQLSVHCGPIRLILNMDLAAMRRIHEEIGAGIRRIERRMEHEACRRAAELEG